MGKNGVRYRYREFKQCTKEAKQTVAIAQLEVYNNLYEEIDTKEQQQKVYKLGKARNKST